MSHHRRLAPTRRPARPAGYPLKPSDLLIVATGHEESAARFVELRSAAGAGTVITRAYTLRRWSDRSPARHVDVDLRGAAVGVGGVLVVCDERAAFEGRHAPRKCDVEGRARTAGDAEIRHGEEQGLALVLDGEVVDMFGSPRRDELGAEPRKARATSASRSGEESPEAQESRTAAGMTTPAQDGAGARGRRLSPCGYRPVDPPLSLFGSAAAISTQALWAWLGAVSGV